MHYPQDHQLQPHLFFAVFFAGGESLYAYPRPCGVVDSKLSVCDTLLLDGVGQHLMWIVGENVFKLLLDFKMIQIHLS